MKLPEIWEKFAKGCWISRKAWKKGFAIRVCNLKKKDDSEDCPNEFPLLLEDTQGFLYHFGGIQHPRFYKRTPRRTFKYGLQYDLFADDWYVADQTQCDLTLAENEK